MLFRGLFSCSLALSLIFCADYASAAQAGSAKLPPSAFVLRGTVVDPERMPVQAASVTAAALEAGATFSATAMTDENGAFALPLGPGRYRIVVTLAGFADIDQVLTMPQSGDVSRAFVFEIAGVRETVSVSAPVSYQVPAISSGTKTATPLLDIPQSVTVVTKELMRDQLMTSVSDVVRYVPGITAHQGENNRDQVIIRGNNSSADFFLNGVRDDVQYYRDLYNLDRIEALKGPNAMIFGRGGGGGVINRVSKEAGFAPAREFTLLGGSFGGKRFTSDVNQPLNDTVSLRVNGIYENSGTFRQFVDRERYGINPTVTVVPSSRTSVTLGFEHFVDNRTADRGIPSYQGRPVDADVSTYFGNPAESKVNARVNLASATIQHDAGPWTIRNRTSIGNYHRWYQNFVPGALSGDKTQLPITTYNNATDRLNGFNQTDVTAKVATGRIRHTLLAGAEFGRQLTDNFRVTGFFNNTATSIQVPYANPIVNTPVTFRQSATDADNHLVSRVAAVYAQDQIELSRFVQLVGGLRFDSFELQYHNNRTGDTLRRVDHLVSPRGGLVVKPTASMSFYGSYTVSYLPSSGDQFSSLTTITEQVKPEKFSNYEIGAKWDAKPDLSFTTAVYRLDRTNTRATDPDDPTRIVQTGSQRTNGYEIGVNGRLTPVWQIAGGYAHQNAFVTSATTSARAGAQVAQVPHHTLSLWNTYQVHPKVGLGLGLVHRTDMYAAVDNTVTLPGYADVDSALYVMLTPKMRVQANVENVFNRTYYANADGNTNITPGSPRALRLALVTRF